jgi:hypothetical protein
MRLTRFQQLGFSGGLPQTLSFDSVISLWTLSPLTSTARTPELAVRVPQARAIRRVADVRAGLFVHLAPAWWFIEDKVPAWRYTGDVFPLDGLVGPEARSARIVEDREGAAPGHSEREAEATGLAPGVALESLGAEPAGAD